MSLPRTADYDVIVAGGGMAGTAAAIGSGRRGARTLLLERNRCLGGAATMRNVLALCDLYTLGETPRLAIRGIADRVLHGLKRRKAVSAPMRYGTHSPAAVREQLRRDGAILEEGEVLA